MLLTTRVMIPAPNLERVPSQDEWGERLSTQKRPEGQDVKLDRESWKLLFNIWLFT